MELDNLYQDIILDHFKHPRNYGPISPEAVLVDEENPTCGDHIRMTVSVESGRVGRVQFDGKGCAISMASSSMMTEEVSGKPVEEVRVLAAKVIEFLRGEKKMVENELGDLMALSGVKEYPLRVKCATLGWHALLKALDRLKA